MTPNQLPDGSLAGAMSYSNDPGSVFTCFTCQKPLEDRVNDPLLSAAQDRHKRCHGNTSEACNPVARSGTALLWTVFSGVENTFA